MPRKISSTGAKVDFTEIVTRRPENNPNRWASMSLGGTTLYAPEEGLLRKGIDVIHEAIENVSRDNLLLIRQLLLKLTRERLGQSLPDRLFGAVLGRALRLGRIVVVPCLTVNNRILRTHLSADNRAVFIQKLVLVSAMLKTRPGVTLVAARVECFPSQGWGTSFMAQQLLGHLAYRGSAVCVDKDLFTLPKSVEHAVVNSRQ